MEQCRGKKINVHYARSLMTRSIWKHIFQLRNIFVNYFVNNFSFIFFLLSLEVFLIVCWSAGLFLFLSYSLLYSCSAFFPLYFLGEQFNFIFHTFCWLLNIYYYAFTLKELLFYFSVFFRVCKSILFLFHSCNIFFCLSSDSNFSS